MVAVMTEALKLSGNEKILEIGTGSGYQAAILAELAEQVYSIERLPAIAKRARRMFDELMYSNIVITIGDGTLGWKEHSPYDRIIVTAASPYPPKTLLEQLKIGGRLIIPIGDEFTQDLTLYIRDSETEYNKESYGGCRFVKLIGEQGWRE
jgi:protein-L-isoaspartate(D-aspartate) O-methyltransferase